MTGSIVTIPTATGAIRAEELGLTLMHEHTVITSPGMPQALPHQYDRATIRDALVKGLVDARSAGIGTIVDCGTIDLGRDPELVIDAAGEAHINVVLATGIWLDVPRWFQVRDIDAATEVFVRELDEGIAGTGVRAGIIKVASHEEVTPHQEKILRAAARAAIATGVSVTTHTLPSARTGLRQLEILRDERLPMDRVIIGHSSCTDREYLTQLYAAGCYVGWDQFGLPEEIGDEDAVIEVLIEFLRNGHARRTLLSGDGGTFVDWDFSEAHGYGYVVTDVIPRLRAAGIPEPDIIAMTVDGPARLLTRRPAGPD